MVEHDAQNTQKYAYNKWYDLFGNVKNHIKCTKPASKMIMRKALVTVYLWQLFISMFIAFFVGRWKRISKKKKKIKEKKEK